jgi:hypothetical protein
MSTKLKVTTTPHRRKFHGKLKVADVRKKFLTFY